MGLLNNAVQTAKVTAQVISAEDDASLGRVVSSKLWRLTRVFIA